MPSTVYKGDLTEISFGHETGLVLTHNYNSSSFTFTHTSTDSTAGTSLITLTNGAASTPVQSGALKYPIGMLVGAKLSIIGTNNYTADDNAATGKQFTVVAQTSTTFTVTPKLSTATSTASSGTDALVFHSFALPALDIDSGYNANANNSSESVLTDQFLGVTTAVTLPETRVDLKRYHVVGLGRDVSVQVPGRFINEGGSFEVNMHNPRWLYYCLGMEAIDVGTEYDTLCDNNDYLLNGAVSAGASLLVFDTSSSNATPTFKAGSSAVAAGDYVIIKDTNTESIVSFKEGDSDSFTDSTCDTDHTPTGGDATVFGGNAKIIQMDSTALLKVGMAVSGTGIAAGSVITQIDSATLFRVDLDTTASNSNQTLTFSSTFGASASNIYYNTTEKSEIRRIVSIAESSGAGHIFLDSPLCFSHADNTSIRFARFNEHTASTGVLINNGGGYSATHTSAMTVDGVDAREQFAIGDTVFNASKQRVGVVTAIGGSTSITIGGGTLIDVADNEHLYNHSRHGSPDRLSDGTLTNPVTRLLYSRSHVPSFAMEVSIRRRDNQADDGTTAEVVDGGTSDAKQLTRVFRGCKVKEFSLTADTDAALRLSVGFDSALCYTDTGRLESSNKGDRYNTHRIFEDTANTDITRKEAGIAVGTQKPYMFYNGTITVAGVQIGQVVSFTVTGTTGVQQFYTINGAPIADAATDQVPFAGARNASIAVEGQTEYMADLEIIVDDPVFYHKMRRAVDHDATTANMIKLSFTKAGSSGTRESIDIYLDDYVITEAPLPIPEDKGPIRAPLKVMPKAMRVVSTDTLFHC